MSVIKKINTQSRPLKWIFEEFKKGNLFVDDSFQRNYVWIGKDRISLVETVIIGYPIPEIYLWEEGTDSETGETRYSIVDGQQRIKSLANYISGLFKLTPSGLEFKSASYTGKFFNELSADQRSDFWGYDVSIRFIQKSVAREDIVKMFLRLNQTSNVLNPQELRNAEFRGEFMQAAVQVASLPFWKKWKIFNDMDIRRMHDIQFASTLLIYSKSGFEDETTQAAINKIYDVYNDEYPDKEKDVLDIAATLTYLNAVIEEQQEIAEILGKKTHAYTIYTAADKYRRLNLPEEIFAEALRTWYAWAEEKETPPPEQKEAVDKYRRLSQEGVQKKANRHKRFELLTDFVESFSKTNEPQNPPTPA